MAERDAEARAAKILGDLLALSLSENDPQADAALTAIRRRAARDAVTGGAVKELIGRLSRHAVDPVDARYLAWTVDEQKREAEELRGMRRQAQAEAESTRRTNAVLAERIGLLSRARRVAWALGFGLGFGTAATLAVLGWTWVVPHVPVQVAGGPGNTAGLAVAADQLRSCFLSSSDSLGGGTSVPLHLLVRLTPQDAIEAVSLAPGQEAVLADAEQRQYADLVLRSLSPGHCGRLTIPKGLGTAAPLSIFLPG